MENNFKDLEKKSNAPPHLEENIKHKINENVGIIRFVFNVFDLYATRVFDSFVNSAKDSKTQQPNEEQPSKNPNNSAKPPHLGD